MTHNIGDKIYWQSILAALVALVLILTGYKLGRMFAPTTMTVVMDIPNAIPKDRPKSFAEALNRASERFKVDYKLGLCQWACENGRQGLEMGVAGYNPLLHKEYPEFTQAYMWASLTASRQKDFCNDQGVLRRWLNYLPALCPPKYAKKMNPFIPYACYRYAPACGWKIYFWNEKTKHGVGYYYEKYTIGELENIMKKKVKERNAGRK